MDNFKRILQKIYNYLYNPVAIGYNYEKGKFPFRQNYSKAFYYYSIAVEKSNPLGYNNLGWLYANGLGVQRNKQKAINFYKKAMKQNLPVAFLNLGNLYEADGLKEKSDEKLKKAFELYSISSFLGEKKAIFNYYNCILNGWGTPKNYKKALSFFLKDAKKDPASAYNVGLIYERSKGILQNYKQAIKFYKLGAKKGDAWSCTNLGNLLVDGKGTTKNLKKAIYYYKKAVKLGDLLSYANLGNTYKNLGKNEKSIHFYTKGAELGEEHCIKEIEKIAKNNKI